ncbi:kynureninase [Parahaliea mediterranea]|uniref:kynureninase n=1 Tax=Parahaliea mediterranea TaxID=651086 RepID=UPI000E2EFE4A|nr:kynureninase [Parahaliea mediterranea]
MAAINRADCEARDNTDPLAGCRGQFHLPESTIYLDGNSLGVLPLAARERARAVLDKEWGEDLIRSWNKAGWWDLPTRIGDKLGKLIGADAGEVVITDSTGINVYKAVAAALQLVPERRVIVLEGSNFPTDNYIVQGLVQQLGQCYEIRFAEEQELASAIDETVAVVCLTQVHYKSGRVLDMAELTRRTHAAGAISVWDLCHSAGALEVDLNGCQADFAVGCTYKYLNGGPGSPGFIFAAKRHHGRAQQPLTGWWGHAQPFAFTRDYAPHDSVRQMLSGTQPILSLALVECGLDVFLAQDMASVRAKSQQLTQLFIDLVQQRCPQAGFTLVSPSDSARRGSQVSFHHAQAYAIVQALIARGVIGDYREPGNMRFGFAPLYNGFCDVWDAVEHLVQVMAREEWRQEQFNRRSAVT